MTPPDAARLLEVSADATAEQIEARFLDLRRKLEDKIAKAPTPGLQAKYRGTLAEITEAFETLTLAADASSLPVLRRTAPPAAPVVSTPTTAPEVRPLPGRAPRQTSSHREFLLVVLVAVLVLGGGGWWVVKTRAEHAEKVRLEAEAKAAAEQQALAAKAAAEQEKQRLEAANASLRAALADARTLWESLEREAQLGERAFGELKSDYREARDKPAPIRAELAAHVARQKQYAEWLPSYLSSHAAKSMLAKLDALIGARAFDDAAALQKELSAALLDASTNVREYKEHARTVDVPIDFQSTPPGIDWLVESTFDGDNRVTFSGHTPVSERRFVGLGRATVTFRRPGWPDQSTEVELDTMEVASARAAFPGGSAQLSSKPADVTWELIDGSRRTRSGRTPALVDDIAPGAASIVFKRPGFKDVSRQITAKAGATIAVDADLRSQVLRIVVAEPEAEIWVDGKFLGRKEAAFNDQTPGTHKLELRHPKWAHYRTDLFVKQEFTSGTRSYSFQTLATQSIVCDNCHGQGHLDHAQRCGECNGTRRIACSYCDGKGTRYPPSPAYPPFPCPTCHESGRVPCESCTDGTVRWQEPCTRCGGDGRVSPLQLNQ